MLTNPQLKVVSVPIGDLKPHPKNPKDHRRRHIQILKQSVSTFGFNVPILASPDGTIIAGHGCWAAARLAGLTEVPVIYLNHLDNDKAAAFMLAHNKTAELSGWNDPLLAEVFRDLSNKELSFELEDTGFETTEIDRLTHSLEEPGLADTVDEYEISAAPAVSRAKDGWALAEHFIFCGSALESASYRLLPNGHFAAMGFIDSPWNLQVDGFVSGNGKIKHREFAQASGEMTAQEFTEFLHKAIDRLQFYCTRGGLIFVCMDHRHLRELLAAADACDLEQINLCVWVKNNGAMGSLYRSRHELVFVFRKRDASHRNNVQLGRSGRNRTNVWNYPGANVPVKGKRILEYHPTPKPVNLVMDAILDCTRPKDFIIDPFLGSGTTLLAAERTGRRAYGIEIDPIYVDTAILRWQRMTGREARHLSTGKTFSEIRAERIGHDG